MSVSKELDILSGCETMNSRFLHSPSAGRCRGGGLNVSRLNDSRLNDSRLNESRLYEGIGGLGKSKPLLGIPPPSGAAT